MRVPKQPCVFFTARCEILRFYPNGLLFFFTAKYQILQLHPNSYLIFLQQNTIQYTIEYNTKYNFENRTQIAICFPARLNFLLVARYSLVFARCSLVFFRCSLIFARCSFNALLVASMHWGINLPLKKTPPPFRQALPLNL